MEKCLIDRRRVKPIFRSCGLVFSLLISLIYFSSISNTLLAVDYILSYIHTDLIIIIMYSPLGTYKTCSNSLLHCFPISSKT